MSHPFVIVHLLGFFIVSKLRSAFLQKHLYSFLPRFPVFQLLSHHFLLFCFVQISFPVLGKQSPGQPCQLTVGIYGGSSLTFFSSIQTCAGPQWPAVQLQLMWAPPDKAFIGSMPLILLTADTHGLSFCLVRLSHSSQAGFCPCYSPY